MKILMIACENPLKPIGGLGVHLHNLSLGLANLGVDVTILGVDTFDQEGGLFSVNKTKAEPVALADWTSTNASYRLFNVFNQNLHLQTADHRHDMITLDNFVHGLLSVFVGESYDVIHLHDSYLLPIALYANRLCGGKLVVTSHLSYSLVHPSRPLYEHYRWSAEQETIAYHKADSVITVSQHYSDTLRDMFGISSKVIPNGVVVPHGDPDIKQAKQRGILSKKLLVGFVGRMVGTKGIAPILRAAEALPDIQFVLISQLMPTMENVDRLVTDIGQAPDNLKWISDITPSNKWGLMRACDVAIMPSLHEPFGIVALEWMALGIPLITSGIDGLGDFCIHDFNCTLAPPTCAGLVSAIASFTRNEATIANGLKTALQYNWEHVAEQTVMHYRSL